MSSIPIQQVVTFASEPFRGNPAFVLSGDKRRPLELMSAVCRHLQQGLVAVLWNDGDEIELGHVTPMGLHPGAGHVTQAAAWVAFNRLRPGATAIDFRLSGGGVRSVWREGGMIWVDWPVMPRSEVDEIAALGAALGRVPRETLDSAFGVIAIYDGAEDVAALSPDLAKLCKLRADTVIVTAPATEADFAIRVFAPKLGLPEDPVCGTAHRILVPMWAERFDRTALVSQQLSERGGRLHCRLHDGMVAIGGAATLFLDGAINLPD